MKNLLLLLVLANVLYFLWGQFGSDGQEPGIVVLDEADLGPELTVTTTADAGEIASVGAVLGSGEPSNLSALVGRSCATIGPFKLSDDADAAATQYAAEGMRTSIRSTQGTIFIGHWVLIEGLTDQSTARDMLDKLHGGGLTDAYIVSNDDGSRDISLGLFGNLERAERVELQAKSLDLPARIIPRTREGTIYYVDIGLPPGRGASAMIDKHGEEMVLLRDAATCPQIN